MNITQQKFGQLEGKDVHAYTLKNDHNFELTCINYGCIITELLVPDNKGNVENVVLGFDNMEDYQKHSPFFGATIGRVAGRIAKGKFELDGKTYQLPINDGNNHLHGGITGFDKVLWDVKTIEDPDQVGVVFTYVSLDGEEGYPGEVNIEVTYIVNNDNELIIKYNGKTNKKTILNLTNHTYFNLSGNLKRDIKDHELTLKSSKFIPLNKELIPTGEYANVDGTPFDFRNGRKVGEGMTSEHDQNVLAGNGYDHPFVLDENNAREIFLEDTQSGRNLLIETDEPCVVFYSGNMLNGDFNIGGKKAEKNLALCLETQKHPDAINHPNFASIVLSPEETYVSQTTYSFNVKK
ncbi:MULTISPECIES: aldose epimerase family protein [Bacillaceae]|uniref:Aldose 1-epimerase n=1 Tax=Evansella alkalicola TaxID=745819 RepID=A0ABS6JR26_9BACI|nr:MULTISPECIES: aldose epimerase family protein [Bacillaceae]MBU9721011.1 galactose mutarotase [Bacillus alkalicola]